MTKKSAKYKVPYHDYWKGDKMRKRILSLCYSIGWVKEGKPDRERLNNWMLKYSYKHKPLSEYYFSELGTLVTQFENMAKSQMD